MYITVLELIPTGGAELRQKEGTHNIHKIYVSDK